MLTIRYNPVLILNIAISLCGLFVVLMLAFDAPVIHENFIWRKPLVGSVFSLICVLGIFAALFPSQCSQTLHFRGENTHSTSHRTHDPSHHPDCEGFSGHVIKIRGHRLCAACTGLLLGALIALIGTAFYFFGGGHAEGSGLQIVLIGAVGIVLGFFQLKFRSFARLTLNVFFVLGAFLILVGIDEITESLFIDLFLVALIVFWILTRIQLSQWDHQRICSSCESPCEAWGTKKKS